MKSGLCILHREIEPDLGWRRVEIRVLPDQDVPLLEAEELEGVEPVRPHVEVAAGVEQRIPERLRLAAGVVQFVAELTDETHANGEARHVVDDHLAQPARRNRLRVDRVAR